jgi:tetratricopeptide (TPR) repeat protein
MLAPVRALVAALSLLPASSLLCQSERPPEAFQLALGLQQRGLHEEAAKQFGDFLNKNGNHALAAEAWYRLGTSRAELDQKDPAIEALTKALQAGARGGAEFRLRAECRYRLGNLLESQGKHRPAVEQFTALSQEVAADHYLQAPARFAAGEGFRELGDDEQAVRAFAGAVEVAVGEQASFRFPALYQLGFALLRSKSLADSASAFGEAAKVAPDDAAKGECLYLQGDTLLRQQEYDAADRALQAAQKLASDFRDDAAFGLGWVALGRQDQKAARRAFQQFLERFADSPLASKARLELGRSLYRDKKYAEAQQALASLLQGEVAPEVKQQAQELTGLCALASGAGEQALGSLQKALAEAAPADRARLSFALGETYANLARWAEAVAAYDAVPGDAGVDLRGDALYGACFALHSLGKHEDSIARAKAVLALQPKHRLADQAAFAIAESQFALQKFEPAEQAYAALVLVPTLRDKAAWKLAWCRYLRGDKAAAAVQFAAIGKTEGSPFAEEALAMQSLSQFEAGSADEALATADRYRARYRDGAFLDRTERVASRVLRQKGDLPAAQKRLERAVAAVGKTGDASGDQIEQAELAYQQGDYQAADGLFAKLMARNDVLGARAIAGRAWCAFELGDDDACSRWLAAGQKHAAVGDQLAGLLELQSALHHRRQEWVPAQAAAKAFLQQFEKHGKAPAMRYSLGVAQARAGDANAARETLAKLLQDGGYERMDRVAYELAWACRRANDEPAALKAFAQVAKDSKDVELAGEANLHLGVAALEAKDGDGKGRPDLGKARESLTKVQGSHRGRALYRLAFAEFDAAGQDPKLLAVARDRCAELAAIEADPLSLEGLYLGGECCQRLGDARGAMERYQALLQKDPRHARADRSRLGLGECAVLQGDGNTAVPVLEEFLRGKDREKSDAARANLFLGRARMLRGEAQQAEASLQRVTELSDGALAAEAQFRIGEVRAQHGDLQGAADAFVKLPILYAQPEWVRRGLLQAGLVYEQLQQPEKAQRFFEELQKLHAGSDEAKTAKQHLRQG